MIRYSTFWNSFLPSLFAIVSLSIWMLGQCLDWSMSTFLTISLPFIHVLSLFSISMESRYKRFSSENTGNSNTVESAGCEDEEGATSASVGPFGCLTIIEHLRQVRRERNEILNKIDLMLRPRSLSIMYVLAPTLGLLVLLLLRLIMGEFHFAGNAPALNFGPLGGGIGSAATIIHDRNNNNDSSTPLEDIIAFDNGHYSAINGLLGVCATVFAYPAILGGAFGCCRTSFWYLFQTLSSFSTMYPVFTCALNNLRSAEYFATSYYTKDATEWASGAVVGIVLGICMTVAAKGRILELEKTRRENNNSNISNNDYAHGEEDDADDDDNDRNGRTWSHPDDDDDLFNFLQCVLGYLFMLSVVVSSFQIGYTWNNCPDGNDTCVNYSDIGIPKIMTSIFVAIPLYIFALTVTKEKRYQEEI